jgi:hypothetical protein
VPLDLRFHATQGNQNRECNELPATGSPY